jgi:hypothetical protein
VDVPFEVVDVEVVVVLLVKRPRDGNETLEGREELVVRGIFGYGVGDEDVGENRSNASEAGTTGKRRKMSKGRGREGNEGEARSPSRDNANVLEGAVEEK